MGATTFLSREYGMLRTTVNMQNSIFFKLGLAASRLGKTRRDIVVTLLMRLMSDIERFQGGFTLVRYQERDPLRQWHCFSISFRKDENEFFTDLRKLGKFSVSYMVAIAVERYLDELMREGDERHNYAGFTHYAVGLRLEGGIICWELYWGDPPNTPHASITTQIQRRTSAPLT
jgi:hypothetical protein